MLSIYNDFPDSSTVQGMLNGEEREFHFIPSSAPQRRVYDNPFAADKTEIHSSLEHAVALRLLPDGELMTGRIHLCFPVWHHTEQRRTISDPREMSEMKPFEVYRARGTYFYSEMRKEPYVDIWEFLPPQPDPELEELSAVAREPVVVDTKQGPLVLNRKYSSFEGTANELGVSVDIEYEGPELFLAGNSNLRKKFKSALNFVDTVLSQEFLDNARKLGAERALPAANRWRHDVAIAEERPTPAPKLGVDDVYKKLTPIAVHVPHRGSIRVEFDDGYLFGGHGLTVKTKRDGTPTSIER